MSIFKPLAAAALLIAGCTTAHASDRAAMGEEKLARALSGRVAGAPVRCLPLRAITSSQIIDRTAILYRIGSTTYVNRPQVGASSLTADPILLTDTHSSQLCDIDTVKLLDRTSYFYRGFVGLGEFVPYRKAR